MKTAQGAATSLPSVLQVSGPHAGPALPDEVSRARAFAEPLLAGHLLDTGEDALAHADGVVAVLTAIGAAPTLHTAAYLVYAGDFLQQPEGTVAKAFGADYGSLVAHTRKLVLVQRAARDAQVQEDQRALQLERVRKMLLAFSHDLRVVLLRLASRLQTLRFYAARKQPCPAELALESQQVFAPLANRLGLWQIKWELEDLSFRFLQPAEYRRVAAQLEGTRLQRETAVEYARVRLLQHLRQAGVEAEVFGRPKHLYSIWKKMQGKRLAIERVFDLAALRVLVSDVPACYAALSCVHERYEALSAEFDDYIARPKSNGYQSLHTVVRDESGAPLEIQIRTRAMHEHAESGVAAHWAYKEAGAKGYGGVVAGGNFEERLAEARKEVLKQLLAWERDISAPEGAASAAGHGHFDDRIYVFTPAAEIIELPAGATPVDFAYSLHTNLGHRCRGARVDGAMVPLQTPLKNGQTVEVVAAKEGGPSMDWLNPELGFTQSHRARAKVRAWFNAQAQAQTIARGREVVERFLQREGRTAIKLDALAAGVGFKSADALFEAVGKDECSLHTLDAWLKPPAIHEPADEIIGLRRSRAPGGTSDQGVHVLGVGSLLTTLARCCRPAPPDDIGGFVTRGKGVAVHRFDCRNWRQMKATSPERVVEVAWGRARAPTAVYQVDVIMQAEDRPGLLRDISEVLAREKMNVTGVNTRSVHDSRGGTAHMGFTVEITSAERLNAVFAQLLQVNGVRSARRR
jgi:GTP pyrophosphokinase